MSQDGDSTVSLSILCQCSATVIVKQMKENPQSKISFVPIVTCPFIGHPWKDFGSIFFIPPQQVFIHRDEIHPILLFWRIRSHSCLSLSSYVTWSNFSILFVPLCWTIFQYVHASLILESSELELVLYIRLSSAELSGIITSLDLFAAPFLIQPKMLLIYFAHCSLMTGARAPFATYSNFVPVLTPVIWMKLHQPN